jgi:hypothetical protein
MGDQAIEGAGSETGNRDQRQRSRHCASGHGFTKHPEIWPPQPPRQIDVDRGFDFVANDANPEDDLVGGFGNFPSHGTGTASVIMSAALPSKIIGVAPLVKLIPLRVSNSVIHLVHDQCHERDSQGC